MAGTRGMNTFSETLQKLLGDFVFMKTLPDADIEWVIDAETNIVEKIRDLNSKGFGSAPPMPGGDPALAPVDPAMAGGPGMAPGPMPPMPAGPMPGEIPGGIMPSPPTGGALGVQTSPQMPGGEELSRLLRGGQ